MGRISELKFLLKDKRFENDRYVQNMGGRKRIMQFLEMDEAIIKQLKFYIKELKNKIKWGTTSEQLYFEGNLEHLEATINKELSFSVYLMQVAEREKLRKEEGILLDVNSYLLSAKMKVERAKKIIRPPFSNPKTALPFLKEALREVE